MDAKTVASAHWSFWAIGAVALFRNVMGGINFIVRLNPDMLASFPESPRAIMGGRPVWATGGFAIAVFGGALGSLRLLLWQSVAYYLFVACLPGVVVTMTHTVGIASSTVNFSPFEILMMIIMPLVVAVLLICYSRQFNSKGWISQEQQLPG